MKCRPTWMHQGDRIPSEVAATLTTDQLAYALRLRLLLAERCHRGATRRATAPGVPMPVHAEWQRIRTACAREATRMQRAERLLPPVRMEARA